MTSKEIELYMRRCFQLAQKGQGNVAPNPLVGAVIVHNGKIIGEGYHRKYGLEHAEPNAIKSVRDKSLLSQSTLFVNLEPCNHYGKTPPCSDLIVKHKIPKVVVCNVDPNPQVSGSGIEKLRSNGIEVVSGILEKEGWFLNRRFFTTQIEKRPYLILKWAQTSNGYVDIVRSPESSPLKISNDQNKRLVHKWRSEEDSILVGHKTVLMDNPSLSTRFFYGKNAKRVVLSSEEHIPNSLNVKDASVATFFLTDVINSTHPNKTQNTNNQLTKLLKEGIQSIIIEGGPNTHQRFLSQGLWDEVRVTISDQVIPAGISAAYIPNHSGKKNVNCGLNNRVEYYYNFES